MNWRIATVAAAVVVFASATTCQLSAQDRPADRLLWELRNQVPKGWSLRAIDATQVFLERDRPVIVWNPIGMHPSRTNDEHAKQVDERIHAQIYRITIRAAPLMPIEEYRRLSEQNRQSLAKAEEAVKGEKISAREYLASHPELPFAELPVSFTGNRSLYISDNTRLWFWYDFEQEECQRVLSVVKSHYPSHEHVADDSTR